MTTDELTHHNSPCGAVKIFPVFALFDDMSQNSLEAKQNKWGYYEPTLIVIKKKKKSEIWIIGSLLSPADHYQGIA